MSLHHCSQNSIAVCMVTHNGSRYLVEQMESIFSQTLLPCCVYVLDDNSTDQSLEQIRHSFYTSNSPINLVFVDGDFSRDADLYTRIASNFERVALAASEHEFVIFADQDDRWLSTRVATQTHRLQHSSSVLTAGNALLVDENGLGLESDLQSLFPVPSDWSVLTAEHQFRSALAAPLVTGAAMAARGSFMSHAFPVPSGWLHDRWLTLVAAANYGLDISNEPVICYRIHPDQVIGSSRRQESAEFKNVFFSAFFKTKKFFDLFVCLRKSTTPRLKRELHPFRLFYLLVKARIRK